MKNILFVLFPIVLFSCKKDKSDTTTEVPLIKTISIVQNGSTPFLYTYHHENGRVKEAVSNANNSGYSVRYTADSVIISNYGPSRILTGTSSWKLNSQGYGQRGAFYTISSNTTAYQSYEYNADNRVTKTTTSDNPPNEYYQFFSGNRLDSFKIINNGKVIVRDIIHESATDIPNTIGNANTGTAFLGKDWLLVKKKTRYRYSSSGLLIERIETTFTYENSNNRVSKYSRVDISNTAGTSTESVQYTYY